MRVDGTQAISRTIHRMNVATPIAGQGPPVKTDLLETMLVIGIPRGNGTETRTWAEAEDRNAKDSFCRDTYARPKQLGRGGLCQTHCSKHVKLFWEPMCGGCL